MYYIKWDSSLFDHEVSRQRKVPYFRGLVYPHWGSLNKAKGFNSAEEAKAHVQGNAPHWLDSVSFTFIHPLNFETRCLRDV